MSYGSLGGLVCAWRYTHPFKEIELLDEHPHPHEIQMISMNKEFTKTDEKCKHLPSSLTKLRLKKIGCTDPVV